MVRGIAHPRRLGLASHLGVILDLPTIGCAKSVLIGEWEEPGLEKGSLRPLIYRGEIVGSVLRTRAAVKPMSFHRVIASAFASPSSSSFPAAAAIVCLNRHDALITGSPR